MARVYNFSAGPAALPEDVLKKAASEMLDYKNSGMSVMEMSHRTPLFQEIMDSTENNLRELLSIPKNYHILFLQGGASLQFAMIPMNLLTKTKKCDFIHTGVWTKKAIKEANFFGEVNIVASSEDSNFDKIPDYKKENFTRDADYFHICSNNTIYGTKYREFPNTGNVPLVIDMSSNFLSEKIDVSQTGVIFAGSQKNIGPAGLTLVIIRDDLVGHAKPNTPTMLNFATHVENGSMFNTPPTFSIYMAKLVFEHIKKIGGINEIERRNNQKAKLLYNFLDESKLFIPSIKGKDRSIMNITFSTKNKNLDEIFIKEATKNSFSNLKGHRTTGGMRASIYNAMEVEGVEKLVEFMKQFEVKN